MDILLTALAELFSLNQLLYLVLGVLIGMVVGILPGMGGTAGMALLLPFVYGMDQAPALALMIGMLATTATGDTFPSILMGIPGGSSSATVLDGYPLSRQGQAARALAASFTASLLGGIFGAVVLTGCVFIARPLILAIGMGEQLLLIVLALTMVGSLTGASPLKGLAACGVGLLIGTIGSAPATGALRFTFGSVYLSDGIPLVVLALGIFAVPEIITLMRQGTAISETPTLGAGYLSGIRDAIRHWWLVLRVSVLGAIIGILPGVGASTADWLAYGHVVQSSKDRSRFGKGDIRGVIAPEAANNAVRGGDLVPTLFFGIPGSGSMALLLGAFILIGLQPGARMVNQNLDLTFVIIWSLAMGNILGAALCILLAGPIARLTLIRYAFLAPLIITLMVFTAWQATTSWGDLLALLGLTLIGLAMKRFEWSRPALVVGFVLSPGLEASLYQTTQVYGLSFLMRPQALLILLMVLASLAVGLRMMRARQHEARSSELIEPAFSRGPQLALTGLLATVALYALIAVWDSAFLTRVYPASVAGVTLLLLLAVALQQRLAPLTDPVLADTEGGRWQVKPGTLLHLAWLGGYVAAVSLLGFTLATLAFVGAFITVECGRPLWRNALIACGAVLVLRLFSAVLFVDFPGGLLPDALGLPDWLH